MSPDGRTRCTLPAAWFASALAVASKPWSWRAWMRGKVDVDAFSDGVTSYPRETPFDEALERTRGLATQEASTPNHTTVAPCLPFNFRVLAAMPSTPREPTAAMPHGAFLLPVCMRSGAMSRRRRCCLPDNSERRLPQTRISSQAAAEGMSSC